MPSTQRRAGVRCVSEEEEGGHTVGAGLRAQASVTLALDEQPVAGKPRWCPQSRNRPGEGASTRPTVSRLGLDYTSEILKRARLRREHCLGQLSTTRHSSWSSREGGQGFRLLGKSKLEV